MEFDAPREEASGGRAEGSANGMNYSAFVRTYSPRRVMIAAASPFGVPVQGSTRSAQAR